MSPLTNPISNQRGSALLVTVLLVPVLTLFVVFASTISHQDTLVTVNDNCHRDAFYNSDAALYGTAKMIGIIGKDLKLAREITTGTGGDAPGVIFHNDNADKDVGFRQLMTSRRSEETEDVRDIEFIKVPGTDIGVESIVDILKRGSQSVHGGGAEFGVGTEGAGSQLTKSVFRIRSQGRSDCPNTAVMVEGDYHMIAANIGEKGI
jgi:hypothetical protein